MAASSTEDDQVPEDVVTEFEASLERDAVAYERDLEETLAAEEKDVANE